MTASPQSAIDRRTAQAQARDAENFVTARDIARRAHGLDWPASGGFVVVKAGEMVLERKK